MMSEVLAPGGFGAGERIRASGDRGDERKRAWSFRKTARAHLI